MLHLHRAARADVLAEALAHLLSTPPEDPFTPDLVAVPTRGMERWLAQTMSAVLGATAGHGDGVCAGVLFPTPHRLLSDAVATASGIEPDADPWLPERLTWTLLEVVDAHLGEPWLIQLANYLGGASPPIDALRRERRLSIVRHLAGLYDRYALHRPAMLAAWAQGRDADAAGRSLPEGARWQAELWRRLHGRIDLPGPAERRDRACARLVEDPGLVELPARLSLFGLTRLPTGHLEVLRALAHGREVHLCLLHPSAELWDAIVARGQAIVPAAKRRVHDESGDLVNNALLASWGRDSREMQLVITGGESAAMAGSDEHRPLDSDTANTLLSRLQADVRADRAPAGAPLPGEVDARASLDPDDHSVVVHACHGRQRQVEVLRDAILHALAGDPTLEPRDVIVMCPDVEAFAPLVQATFGSSEPLDGELAEASTPQTTDLRVRLADRSLAQTNPLLGVVSSLMELVNHRVTASEVLDLADRGPVRRRFGFDDDDLTQLQDWISASGIRWGLDAEHRAPYKLQDVGDGTWRAGIDRLLLGATMTEDDQRRFAGVLPLDDVDSRAIELAGRFAELGSRLQRTLDELSAPRPLDGWARALAEAADGLARTTGRDRWQRAELQRILDEMADESGDSPSIAPAELRSHLAERLAGRPTRANFRTGHLTVCTLTPMRSVPHRVVCLLGLDDEEFPRRTPRDGDDLMLSDPHVGERDPRSEDRQLLLDALLAATERLIITYSGNDERTNTELPPAVPIGELLDAVDATVRCDGQDVKASDRIRVRHPLQPFDPRNFSGGSPWSFDAVALEGARALTSPRRPPAPFLSEPLAELAEHDVELDDLVSFVTAPVRSFLRRRLGVSLYDSDDEVDDGLPIDLDALEKWGVADRLLQACLRGTPFAEAVAAEKSRGTLPPGALGDGVIDSVKQVVIAIATEAGRLTSADPERDPIDVRVELDGGRSVTGTVTGVTGDTLLSVSYSRVAPRHRMGAWVRFLALAATDPQRPFEAMTIGRGSGRDDVRTCLLKPFSADPEERVTAARAELSVLLDLYDRGMREPLLIFPKSSSAWAEARTMGQDPEPAARREWESGYGKWGWIEREDADLSHTLVLGGRVALAEVLATAPAADESGDGWADDEETRLGRLARRYWDALAAHEETSSR
ncbi:MAG TPA: exodeoxyribonuclease V subunit gamma [Solirubrobacteraceae bacterium]|nr:exodeoxyribonuclease V subunit gamma [Solirubrobacteraceae bacterium]